MEVNINQASYVTNFAGQGVSLATGYAEYCGVAPGVVQDVV